MAHSRGRRRPRRTRPTGIAPVLVAFVLIADRPSPASEEGRRLRHRLKDGERYLKRILFAGARGCTLEG